MIFELSWESEEVPVEPKNVPIFKKYDPGNYRPISLTSGTGKGALAERLGQIRGLGKQQLYKDQQRHLESWGQFWAPLT